MEAPSETPSKKTKPYMKLFEKLLEIEVEVINFTHLPTDTPGFDRLAQHIEKKFAFFHKLLIAESASQTLHDLLQIERKLEALEDEFHQSHPHSDSHSAIVHEDDDSERSSSSLCHSCTSKERPVVGNVNWKVYENPAVLCEALMSPSEMFPNSEMSLPPEMFQNSVAPVSETSDEAVMPRSGMTREAVMPWSDLEDDEQVSWCGCDQREQTSGCKERGGRRRWLRMLVIFMAVVSVTVSFSVYTNCDQHEGVLTPT